MKKTIYVFSFIFLVGVSLFLTPTRISTYANEPVYDNAILINNYNELDYTNSGSVTIQYLYKDTDGKDLYNIFFHGNGLIYQRSEVGLPACYDHSKDYEITYKVNSVDGFKRVFMNFKDDVGFEIEWELTSGEYLANNVVNVTAKEIKKESNILTDLASYWVYFNVDIPMDKIYQIDADFYWYVDYWIFKTNKTHVEDFIIYNQEINTPNIIFSQWLSNLTGLDEESTITASDDPNYTHKAMLFGPVSKNIGIEDLVLIKFYYVTDGRYYETDTVHDDPTDYEPSPFDEYNQLLNDLENIKNKFNSVLSWINNHSDQLILTFISIVGITLFSTFAPYILMFFKIIFNSFVFIIKSVFFIIKLPFMILSLLFGTSKRKVAYRRM